MHDDKNLWYTSLGGKEEETKEFQICDYGLLLDPKIKEEKRQKTRRKLFISYQQKQRNVEDRDTDVQFANTWNDNSSHGIYNKELVTLIQLISFTYPNHQRKKERGKQKGRRKKGSSIYNNEKSTRYFGGTRENLHPRYLFLYHPKCPIT